MGHGDSRRSISDRNIANINVDSFYTGVGIFYKDKKKLLTSLLFPL